MPNYTTSSQIGASLNASSTTAQFALNQKVLGSNDSEWHYVIATATLTTGMFCYIQSAGTADILTTALLGGAGVLGTTGNLDIGVVQCSMVAGEYGFVAKKGQQLYLRCSGTTPPGYVGFNPTSGTLVTGGLVGAGTTALGVFVIVSASTATASVTTGLVVYPRVLTTVPPM